MRTTNIRFTGLASGLDTESMVKSMVMPYKMKVDAGKQNQTMLEWKKDAWRDMNKNIFNFYDQQLNKLRLESTFNKKNVSVSNSDKIEIRPNSTLPEGTHTIDSITQLAESAKVSTDKLQVSGGGKVTKETKLKDLVGEDGKTPILKEGQKLSIKVSDSVDSQGRPIYKEVELSGDMTVGQMQSKMNSAMPNTNVTFDESAGAFFISGKKTGVNQFIKISADKDDDRNSAFKLLGIKATQQIKPGEDINIDDLVGTETVLGQITFEGLVKAPATTKLSDLGIKTEDLASGDQLNLKMNGKDISITLTEDMTLEGLAKKVSEEIAKTAGLKDQVTFKYDATKGKFAAINKDNTPVGDLEIKVTNKDKVANQVVQEKFDSVNGFTVKQTQVATGNTTIKELGLGNNALTIKVGDITFALTEDMTLKEVAEQMQKKISENPALKDNTVFSFDEKNGKFLMSKNIDIEGTSADLEKIGIRKDQNVFSISGQNAELFYNGVKIESESNNVSVNGFNFTVKSTTAAKGEEITVVSTFDTDAVVNTVKTFVGEYNKLIEEINKQISAPNVKGYEPLTDEQKKEMSDYEIEQWEKKIKDSLFRNDPDLKKVVTEMREIMGGIVEGNTFGSLSSIGIATGDWKENGKLHFDEDKFRKALSDDADGVIQLFAGTGDPENLYLEKNPDKTMEDYTKLSDKEKAEWQNRTKGVFDRMYDHITQTTKSTEMRSTYSFYNDKSHNKKIQTQIQEVKEIEARMIRMEDMYYKKFTAMEKMMSQLNSQSSWLSQQMGGM